MTASSATQRFIDGTAWSDFCDALKEAGEGILRETTPSDPLTRVEGVRYLTRLLRATLAQNIEFGDPRFPGFFQLSNETIKIGNDNPDNVYWNANISGAYDYRISGTRGSVHYLSFGTKSGGYAETGMMEPTGHLDAKDMDIDADGSLELIVSCKEQSGNWLRMTPETTALIVRETFLDRELEQEARLKIERIGREDTPLLEAEQLEAALAKSVQFMKNTTNIFVDWMDLYSAHINELPSDDQERCQRAGGDASIHYLQSYWKLAPDEALVIDARTIPECSSWNLQISNYWMESLDYRYHRICINKHNAVYAEDGSVQIVLAHADPGTRHPNWLTTDGHSEGGMLFRWIDASEHPPVDTRVVRFADL